MRNCMSCLYHIEESWEGGVCGNRKSNAYKCRVTQSCTCRHHKEEACYSPSPRSMRDFCSASSSYVS